MATKWREMAVAAIVAVGATAAVAAVAGAEPANPASSARVVSARPGQGHDAPGHRTEPTLGAVTEHAIDPDVLAAAASLGGGQTVTEVVRLEIIGGDLELMTDHQTVVLERTPGASNDWTGVVAPVRVVDARGTYAGWTVRWTVDGVDVATTGREGHVPAAKVHMTPDDPVVVAGTAEGLVAGKPGPAVAKGRPFLGADAGWGAGTYEAGGTISMRLPASIDADQVVVELSFAVD